MGGFRRSRWCPVYACVLFLMVAWFVPVSCWAASTGDEDLYFSIWRNNRNVGYDYLRFQRSGDVLRVERFIRIDIGLLSIPIYTYRYHSTARWDEDRLITLLAHTNDDGTTTEVSVRRVDGQLRVVADGDTRTVPGDLIPTNWWNPAILNRDRVLNTQTGAVEEIRVEAGPTESVPADGRTIQARRYTIRGDLELTIWFDDRSRWARLAFTRYGSSFTYRRESNRPPTDFEDVFTHPSRPAHHSRKESK